MRRRIVLTCVPMLVATAGLARDDVSALLDGAPDQVLERVDVPEPSRRVGEVRIVRRGRAAVVETLLDTKLLKRVVAEIREKETANWPAGRDGHGDSLRYLAALEQTAAALRGPAPVTRGRASRRVRMFIDFILTEDASIVVLGSYAADMPRVTARAPSAVLELSRAYVERNLRLIVADSFDVDESAAAVKLAPLLGARP